MTVACTGAGCSGTVLADGYCDTCGAKAGQRDPYAMPAAPVVPRAPAAAGPSTSAGGTCRVPACGGTVLADGYCDTCGTKASAAAEPPGLITPPVGPIAISASARPAGSFVTGSARSRSRRASTNRSSARSRRSGLGSGLVYVPPAPAVNPSRVVLADPEVAEEKRFCSHCGEPVGRTKDNRPGRVQGFCSACRHAYDFVPKLQTGDLVDGQYEVAGCLAHGGLGWIYLVRDKAVNDRWCVLKGLLDAGDHAAMAAAVLERGFLAQVQHPRIVEIYNFVSHEGAGYIVMEYVGGPSLKQLLKDRRAATSGKPDPLPVAEACAFVLGALDAFTYLHDRGLVYCDFKPDNLIHIGDDVKLIDLGGVRRINDPAGDIYGTVGFQAPEIAEMGPSVASDIYTIGRTLAVLTLDFSGYQSTFQHALPDADNHPALLGSESFHRLLLKACAPHPDDRFQSVTEFGEQLQGVLREVVAVGSGRPQPAASAVFASPPPDGTLPNLGLDPADPAAQFLADLPAADPATTLKMIRDAVADGQVPDTVEVQLRRARELLEAGDTDNATTEARAIERSDPWEWRAVWVIGVASLTDDQFDAAAAAFDRCMTEVPGELAPKLAAAIVAERAGDRTAAAARFGVVARVDPNFVAAVHGLARCYLDQGNVAAALLAYRLVPRSHRAWVDTQVEAVRALIAAGRVQEAAAHAEAIDLDHQRRAELEVDILQAALAGLASGAIAANSFQLVGGTELTQRGVRRALERSYRLLADIAPNRADRLRLVDSANAVRAVTLV